MNEGICLTWGMSNSKKDLATRPNPVADLEWDLNVYCTVLNIATMLHLTAEPLGRPVASSMCFY